MSDLGIFGNKNYTENVIFAGIIQNKQKVEVTKELRFGILFLLIILENFVEIIVNEDRWPKHSLDYN